MAKEKKLKKSEEKDEYGNPIDDPENPRPLDPERFTK